MTCGMALLLEWYRRSLGPGLSIERSRDKGLESDVDMRDPDIVLRLAGRAGATRLRWSHRRQRRGRDDDFCAVNHLFPPEGRFDEYRRCRSHRIFH